MTIKELVELNEAIAPRKLYHYTSLISALNIIDGGKIGGTRHYDRETEKVDGMDMPKKGVSFVRPSMASKDNLKRITTKEHPRDVRIILDAAKASDKIRNFRLKKINEQPIEIMDTLKKDYGIKGNMNKIMDNVIKNVLPIFNSVKKKNGYKRPYDLSSNEKLRSDITKLVIPKLEKILNRKLEYNRAVVFLKNVEDYKKWNSPREGEERFMGKDMPINKSYVKFELVNDITNWPEKRKDLYREEIKDKLDWWVMNDYLKKFLNEGKNNDNK
jgi:hypothetical protein